MAGDRPSFSNKIVKTTIGHKESSHRPSSLHPHFPTKAPSIFKNTSYNFTCIFRKLIWKQLPRRKIWFIIHILVGQRSFNCGILRLLVQLLFWGFELPCFPQLKFNAENCLNTLLIFLVFESAFREDYDISEFLFQIRKDLSLMISAKQHCGFLHISQRIM